MKKWIIGLALAGILGFLAVALFMGPRPQGQAALLAGEDAVAFVNIPDIPRTGFRWTQCAWASVVAEPSMRAFLAEPMRVLGANSTATEAKEKLAALLPGNVFGAAYPAAEDQSAWVVGVQFWGKRADWDGFVRWALPEEQTAPEDYRGIAIASGVWQGLRIYHACVGRWGLASPDLPRLRDAIDRATGEPPSPSLRSRALFSAVSKYWQREADFTVFLALDGFWESLLQTGELLGARPNPSHVAAVRSVSAVGASWKIDGSDFQETLVALAPESLDSEPPAMPQEIPGGPDTLAFVQAICPPSFWEALAMTTGGEQSGIADLCESALKPSFTASLTAGTGLPSATLSFPVRDSDAAIALAEALTPMLASLPPDGGWDCGVGNGIFRISNDGGKSSPGLSPLNDAASVRRARMGHPHLLLVLDSALSLATLAPAADPALKSTLLQAGPMKLDFSQFPSIGPIGSCLSPVVVAARRPSDAVTLESTGPATPLLAATIAWAIHEAQAQQRAGNQK